MASHRTAREVVGRTTCLFGDSVIHQGFLPLSNLLHLRMGATLQAFSVSGKCKAVLPVKLLREKSLIFSSWQSPGTP